MSGSVRGPTVEPALPGGLNLLKEPSEAELPPMGLTYVRERSFHRLNFGDSREQPAAGGVHRKLDCFVRPKSSRLQVVCSTRTTQSSSSSIGPAHGKTGP